MELTDYMELTESGLLIVERIGVMSHGHNRMISIAFAGDSYPKCFDSFRFFPESRTTIW